jgi:AraC family transcriptional regulator of adaptative response / DNA-3-methyladenine glycosylase II
VMRALHWPDGFPADSAALQHAAGATSATALRAAAEHWRPWRAYAAMHLWLRERPM